MDPSNGVVRNDKIARWAGISGARDDQSRPKGSLFQLLGVAGDEPPRTIDILPAKEVMAAVRSWRVLQAAPAAPEPPAIAIAQVGQAGIFARTADMPFPVCGLEKAPVATAVPPGLCQSWA